MPHSATDTPELVLDTPQYRFYWLDAAGLMVNVRYRLPATTTEAQYEGYVHDAIATLDEYQPHLVLLDARRFQEDIPKKLLSWSRKQVKTVLQRNGVEAVAVVNNRIPLQGIAMNFFQEVFLSTPVRYFDALDEAIDWLLKDTPGLTIDWQAMPDLHLPPNAPRPKV